MCLPCQSPQQSTRCSQCAGRYAELWRVDERVFCLIMAAAMLIPILAFLLCFLVFFAGRHANVIVPDVDTDVSKNVAFFFIAVILATALIVECFTVKKILALRATNKEN